MVTNAFFNGLSPAMWYSYILFNQMFGTDFKPTEGMPSSMPTTGSEVNAVTRGQMDALNGLYQRMYDVLSKADQLSTTNQDSAFFQQTSSSSDTDVAEIQYFNGSNYLGDVPDSTFNLTVAAIAAETVFTSDALDPGAATAIGTGDNQIQIQVGSDAAFNVTWENIAGTNLGALELMAEAINSGFSSNGYSDYTATVEEGANDQVYLKVTTTLAGTDAGFTMSETGTGTPMTDINLAQTQAASDASYTLDGASYTQGNNAVMLLDGKLILNLKGAGSTTVTIEPDRDNITSKVESLISSMNDLTAYLASNSYLKSSLSTNWARLLDKTAFTLSGLGVSQGTNSYLSLDATVFDSALQSDLASVREAIGGISSLVSDINSYGTSITTSPGAGLLKSPPKSWYGSLYLRSLSSSPYFRQGSTNLWQVV